MSKWTRIPRPFGITPLGTGSPLIDGSTLQSHGETLFTADELRAAAAAQDSQAKRYMSGKSLVNSIFTYCIIAIFEDLVE